MYNEIKLDGSLTSQDMERVEKLQLKLENYSSKPALRTDCFINDKGP